MTLNNKKLDHMIRKFVEQADHCMLNKQHSKEDYLLFQKGFFEALNCLKTHKVKDAKQIENFLCFVEKLHSEKPIGLNVPLLMLRIESNILHNPPESLSLHSVPKTILSSVNLRAI